MLCRSVAFAPSAWSIPWSSVNSATSLQRFPQPAVHHRRRTRSPATALDAPRDSHCHANAPLTEPAAPMPPLKRLLSGFDPTPELGAILTTYFVQGALGVSRLALLFFLKDDLHLSPAAASALTGLAVFPWLVKPLYGFMTDSLPIFGFRRRSYLLVAGALGASAWFSLATVVQSPSAALAASLASSLSVAVSDVVVDSIVVERTRDLSAARSAALQSLCWGTSAIGGLLSAYFGGTLLESLTPRTIFALTALLPLGTTALAALIAERRVSLSYSDFIPDVRRRTGDLFGALRNPSVFLPALFVFFWQATPSPETALFYFQTNELHFGPEFLGRVRLASSAAALAGIWLYNTRLRDVPIKVIMKWATLVGFPLSLTPLLLVTRANLALGISDQMFALTDTTVLTALGQLAFMPTLVLAARLCPPGVEGTLFAALMSVYNASGATSTELGALLTAALGVGENNFDNLALLVLICAVSGLLPLPLLGLIDRAPPASDDEVVSNESIADAVSVSKANIDEAETTVLPHGQATRAQRSKSDDG